MKDFWKLDEKGGSLFNDRRLECKFHLVGRSYRRLRSSRAIRDSHVFKENSQNRVLFDEKRASQSRENFPKID